MRRFIHLAAISLLAASIMLVTDHTATAGRTGGPMTAFGKVGIGKTVYYDISFAANERAVVTVTPMGNTIFQLLMYDSDGHVVSDSGLQDRRGVSVAMDVYTRRCLPHRNPQSRDYGRGISVENKLTRLRATGELVHFLSWLFSVIAARESDPN